MKKFIDLLIGYKSIIAYLFFGGCSTIINIVAYYFSYNLIYFNNVVSTIIAWFAAVIFAFITNKLWVFESHSFNNITVLYELFTFFAFRVLTGALDVLIMWIAVDKYSLSPIVWKIISNVIVIILNYIASKIVVFKRR